MSTTSRQLNLASVKQIMNKRSMVPASAVGKKGTFTIQSDGNVIDVKNTAGELVQSITEPGMVLRKRIFNVKANSGIAITNPRNLEILRAGMAAEKAGDAEEAHKQFNAYLNATQISFGILLPHRMERSLGNGVEIAARVQLITTEAGSLLTLDPDTISLVVAEVYGSTTFDVDALLGTSATPAEGAAPVVAAEAVTTDVKPA